MRNWIVRTSLVAALAVMLGTVFMADSAFAQIKKGDRKLGVGVVLGEPIGGTVKYWFDARQAVDVRVGYSFSDVLDISGDYVFHFPGAFGKATRVGGELAPYVGGGVSLFYANNDEGRDNQFFDPNDDGSTIGMGLRVPLGVEWLSSEYPIGLFAEVAPGLQLFPNFGGYIQGGIGGRFYF